MSKLKIILVGCVEFSLKLSVAIMKKKNIEIIGICTKKKSSFNSDFCDLSFFAKKNKIPYLYCENINDKKNFDWVKKKTPDFIICVGWPNLLSDKFLNLPRFLSIGYHPSDLPKNRGRNPLIWSIILQLKNSASCFFIMNKNPDDGQFISKKYFKISKNETAYTLYKKITKIAISQLNELFKILNEIKNKNFLIQKKKKKNKGNILRKRSYSDGVIDWRMDANAIFNLVNALSYPYPGASFYYKKREYKLIKAKIIKSILKLEPGKVIKKINHKPIIKCGNNALKLLKTIPAIKCKSNDYIL